MKKLCFTFITTLQYLMLVAQTGTITVTQIAQRTDGTGLIDVYFNLSGPDSAYYISLEASLNSGTTYAPVHPLNVTGNVGPISPGTGKHIVWNGKQSSPNIYSSQTKMKLIASTTAQIGFCGSSITINHIAGEVAPVNKTATYGTVTNIPGEQTKCWITSNLGADHEAIAYNDNTEASAGWYWQFNRKQGYKRNGATPTPTWTSTCINESSDWISAKDPCALELGCGWRIPTKTEWTNVDASGNWTNWNGTWNSGLKLHPVGYLDNGYYYYSGPMGYYWGSTQEDGGSGSCLIFYSISSYIQLAQKATGLPLRCLKDSGNLALLPTVTTSEVSSTGQNTATSGGSALCEGGSNITNRGICWNTTTDPTIEGCHTMDGNGTGTFVSNLTGLNVNTLYHYRAYATNSFGTSYGNELAFTMPNPCAGIETLIINHVTSDGVAPVNKTVTYGTIHGISGEPNKCWITSNLGADHQATSISDATEASAGWYWQFNRQQGYKFDGTVLTPNTWITSISENSDWLPTNDPCTIELGSGWRLPTYTEWMNVNVNGNWSDRTDPWNSGLKLHGAGVLESANNSLNSRGLVGFYLSSTQYNSDIVWCLYFLECYSDLSITLKACGNTVRCLKD
jgi:hypothetical protein